MLLQLHENAHFRCPTRIYLCQIEMCSMLSASTRYITWDFDHVHRLTRSSTNEFKSGNIITVLQHWYALIAIFRSTKIGKMRFFWRSATCAFMTAWWSTCADCALPSHRLDDPQTDTKSVCGEPGSTACLPDPRDLEPRTKSKIIARRSYVRVIGFHRLFPHL